MKKNLCIALTLLSSIAFAENKPTNLQINAITNPSDFGNGVLPLAGNYVGNFNLNLVF